MPTLETPEGGIFESNAIARYVARLAPSGLLGSTAVEAVRSSLHLMSASAPGGHGREGPALLASRQLLLIHRPRLAVGCAPSSLPPGANRHVG